MTVEIHSLADIASDYDALFCDVWGVVHNGREAFRPAVEALIAFRAGGGRVALVTNAPRRNDIILPQLARLKVPPEAFDVVVTSGDAIRAELQKRAPGPFYKIGPDYDSDLWEGLGLVRSELAGAAFFAISGLNNDAVETPADYEAVLSVARRKDLELLCANPDIEVRVGDRLIWCAGAIARDYEKLGGRVVMAGKPFAPIYQRAHDALALGDGARVLAIGDGIGTDVKGANAQGLHCLFVASGMHGERFFRDGEVDMAAVDAALAAEDVSARYVITALR